MSDVEDLSYEHLMRELPKTAKIFVREGPKGHPWRMCNEYCDEGSLSPESFKLPPIEERIASRVKSLVTNRDCAVLIVWD